MKAAQPTSGFDQLSYDREPARFLGSIQAFGFPVAAPRDWIDSRISDNAQSLLGR